MSGGAAAVVLLSGGLDSATCLAIARSEGFAVHALTVDYGQRHRVELEHAARLAKLHGAASHRVVRIDLRAVGGSALTAELGVPKDRPDDGSVPVTYVPARNTVFLGVALGLAEVTGARSIFIGANAVDYSGYPDCRPAFLDKFAELAAVATVAGLKGARFEIRAPLLRLSKAEIIRRGDSLGVDYALTLSCYDPDDLGRACGHCDACRLRAKGFQEAGLPDPTVYAP